jgi:hypothetical protein
MAKRPKGIWCKLIIDNDDLFDGVDYQEKGEFETVYFNQPETFRDIKVMFQNRKLVTSGAWPRRWKALAVFARECMGPIEQQMVVKNPQNYFFVEGKICLYV